MISRKTLAAVSVLAVASSMVALATARAPYAWIAGAWAIVCIFLMLAAKTTARRALWFNVAVVVAALGFVEGWVGVTDENAARQQTWSNPENIFQRDDTLGHRPPPGHVTSCTLHVGDELVYDVVYTIGENGLRVGPPEGPEAPDDCVLFFGGSYTFGEGVNDDQTMPYLVGVKSGGRYRVRNFGFSGYGPHQMLAAIESGVVESAADCNPVYAVYQAHPHHVLRASGKWWWDKHGPRYEIDSDGRAVRNGNFDDGDGALLGALLDDSAAAIRIRDQVAPDDRDLALTHAIVARARDLLQARYPEIELHVVHWDIGGPYLFGTEALSAGMTIHRLTDIFPPRDRWEGVYTFEKDVHPTPHAHEIMADYVVREILALDPADLDRR